MEDENFYIVGKGKGKEHSSVIEDALENELLILQRLSRLSSGELKSCIDYNGFLPDWNTSEYDFISCYKERIRNISTCGFGMFSKHRFFTVETGEITPVAFPDQISLSSLYCYSLERVPVINNTRALLAGNEAVNALLYGDAGTGKSSTVKAVANEFKDMGLRLIEVKKTQLYQLPDILGKLAGNPLKFIIFIDDLSFMNNDDNFTALKACLEGSVSVKSKNVVIYATSNRRHLVKEIHSDRTGDELHVNDALQETTGLAARFGLTVTFQKPGKDVYLQIVENIAAGYGIAVDDELLKGAEAFAIRKSGRSPRTAKQFIELQKSPVY